MERKCTACGARLSEGMKICANCGKVVAPLRKPVRQTEPINQRSNVNRNKTRPQVANKAMPPNNQKRKAQQDAFRSQNNQKRSNRQVNRREQDFHAEKIKTSEKVIKRRVLKTVKIALIVFALYAVISIVQIFRVKIATYDFQIDMKMSQENYGQAIDNFFDSGHWVYNPFTFTVTYKGEKKSEGDYEMKFSVIKSVKLKSVAVDGKVKDEDMMESAIMGLFI